MSGIADSVKPITDVIQTLGSLATLLAALGIIKQVTKWKESLENQDRVTKLVEGDTTKHDDENIRIGLLGRTKRLEGIVPASITASEKNNRLIRAILRGLGVPSDLSDEHKLEIAIKERVSDFDYKEYRKAIINDQDERLSTLEPREFEERKDRYLPGQYSKVNPPHQIPKTPPQFRPMDTDRFDPEDTQSGKKRRR